MTTFSGKASVVQKLKRVENLLARAGAVSNIEVQADLARLGCVQLSGFLEHVLYDLILAWASRRVEPRVQQYLERQLERFQNPKSEKIAQLLGQFDEQWKREYEELENRDAIDSVVSLRNSIAHGENTGVGLVAMKDYIARIRPIVDWLITKFDA